MCAFTQITYSGIRMHRYIVPEQMKWSYIRKTGAHLWIKSSILRASTLGTSNIRFHYGTVILSTNFRCEFGFWQACFSIHELILAPLYVQLPEMEQSTFLFIFDKGNLCPPRWHWWKKLLQTSMRDRWHSEHRSQASCVISLVICKQIMQM